MSGFLFFLVELFQASFSHLCRCCKNKKIPFQTCI